jgi:hypothetical protein
LRDDGKLAPSSQENSMKPLLLIAAFLFAVPAFAADKPASEATIRKLLEVSEAKSLVDKSYDQMDGILDQALAQALGGKSMNAEQEKLAAEMRGKVVALMREQLGWEKLEPTYVKLYAETFSESDVEGMLDFYKTPAGKSLLQKMPLLMENLMRMLVVEMQSLMPKLRPMVEDYTQRIVEAGK